MAATSSPLLVPLVAEALVVNRAVVNDTPGWSRWQVDYEKLKAFTTPAPSPFSATAAPDIGIHVRWALPKALTHGSQVTATVTATLTGDQVTGVTVADGGYGYETPPLIELTGGGGTGATASASIDAAGVVTSVTVTTPGSSFTEAPAVIVSPSPSIAFPLVPNRWLVVRYDPVPAATPTARRTTKTWLVESDYVSDVDGTSSFVNPRPAKPGVIEPTKIGRTITPLSAWEGGGGELFLRAVGPGDATFHTYAPGMENVFSFHDDLDHDLERSVDFTYLVVGWYSDPTQDPLYGPVTGWTSEQPPRPIRTPWTAADQWNRLLDALNWEVQDTTTLPPDSLPAVTTYHALISGVHWNNTEKPPWKGNDIEDMTVAVGNTAVDALAALVEHKAGGVTGPADVVALEALQYGELQTLDKPDGFARLDLAIHNASFGSAPGGTVWTVAAVADLTATGRVPTGVAPPPAKLTLDQQEKLGALNRAQRSLDDAVRHLISLRGELYDAWWKLKRAQVPGVGEHSYIEDWQGQVLDPLNEAVSPTHTSSLYQQVVASNALVSTQAAAIPSPTDPVAIARYLAEELGLQPSEYQLRPATAPRFYHPVDPVVLVSGLTASDAQGKLASTAKLSCRLATQAVTGVKVDVDGSSEPVTSTTRSVADAVPAPPTNASLGPAVTAGLAALALETFFVDPANATAIVGLGLGSTNVAVIANLEEAMAAGTAETASIDEPLIAATAFAIWKHQPFSPLFLEWSANFFYTVGEDTIQTDNKPFAALGTTPPEANAKGWAFNGTDYDWHGGNPAAASPPKSYEGRTFLTPQSIFVLERRLEKHLDLLHDKPAELQAVENLIEQVGTWNFLSQRLSGLNDQFITKALGQSHQPGEQVAAQIGQQFDTTPDPELGTQDTSFGEFNPYFFPVRGGFLVIEKLRIVDVFGQVIDLMQAGGNVGTGVSWVPIRGRGLDPAASAKLSGEALFPAQAIKLPPRLVQSARLDFRFVSGTDDAKETGLHADSSPVCGWVLPNHLDGGLAVFDAAGHALGELLLLEDVGGTRSVKWLAAPGSPAAAPSPSSISNRHLQGFVAALTDLTDPGAGVADLLSVIDETLWTIDPLGGRDDEHLSVLIGRPLALLRASLQFQLRQSPVTNQSWRDTMSRHDANLPKVEFAVRLGSLELYNDGLLGYFVDDTYARFNSVHVPSGFGSSTSPYLTPIGVNGNYVTLPFDPPTNTTQLISMLMDPRGDVHATTGILPTKTISVPPSRFEAALKRMAMTFRIGPILSESGIIRIPYPAERHGTWSWVRRDAPAASTYQVDNIVHANEKARLATTPPRLLEGWLKLDPTDIEH